VLISFGLVGTFLIQYKRDRDKRAAEAEQKRQAAFLELERRRMKVFPRHVMKEVVQTIKENYPDSNRHERRAAAVRYKATLNNS
jgi:hypothetical protein